MSPLGRGGQGFGLLSVVRVRMGGGEAWIGDGEVRRKVSRASRWVAMALIWC
jgi:hypothetical protein